MIKLPQVAYHEVEELPFSKQLNSTIYDTVKVRGLVSLETKEISKKDISTITLKELRDIYSDGIIVLKKDGEDVSVDKLIEADLYFLMFLVNILTQPDYKVNYKAICSEENCNAKVPFGVTIQNIAFKPIPVPKFPIPAKLSIGETFHINALTLADLIEIESYCLNDKELKPAELRFARAVTLGKYEAEIEATDPLGILKEKLNALDQLHSSDNLILDKKMDMMKFELKTVTVDCPKCKVANEFNLGVNLKDLIPSI